jgi:hypothetical protein
MTQDEIQLVQQMIDAAIKQQAHTGIDSKRINGRYLLKAPQPALTAENAAAFSTAGATKLDSANITVLDNMRDRVSEIETILTNLGLIS